MGDVEAIRERLEIIQERIATACRRAGRSSSEVTLVGVSKGHPVETLVAAWQAGLRVFGENRVQEAESKVDLLPKEAEWHLIGPLQSNKARRATHLFSWIHSVDRVKIARAIDREAATVGKSLQCFLEVNLGKEESKHGFSPDSLLENVGQLSELRHLQFVGLMAIPPRQPSLAFQGASHSPETSSGYWFSQLRQLRDRLVESAALKSFPGLLSMGMSGDFEVAIEEGATHIRVGTALFGPRQAK